MGNDGGSIPTRRELVKEAAKSLTTTQVKEVQTERQEYGWSNDPLTREPLAKPIMSESSGILFNKQTILEYLVQWDASDARKIEADKLLEGRVKSLKDVVEVKFEVEENQKTLGSAAVGRTERWICPITRTELGPKSKAVYLVPCGHAFAGSVVKEVSGETCLQCNEAYAENDIIPILPTSATDIARLGLRLKTLQEKGLTHALKKAKKEKKDKKRKNGADEGENGEAKENDRKKDRMPKEAPVGNDGIKNASTAYLTKKVLEEQEERNKRRKLEQNENVKSLFHSRDAKPDAKNSADYMTRGFSYTKR
ncbi:Rtf2 RING-finger-domain-containing protein [Lophiotrema nucula]|uniref:Rtf2 RING-finger-domain-containing protein n=1 Tax=Lophiotrema nucula TaxID=690887 RepID=A0A6A5YXW9_9PLEO|nr:Rtf2 RING-finger-domain-containing protein [Lophiotrema nucula]